jgi:hypothetical protein
LSTGKYPNVINVFFMLTVIRVEVESGRIRHITPGLVRYDCDVVAYLALVWIALEGVKRVAYRNISRPGHAGVSAKGIEKLGISVIGSISRVIPDRIESSIRRY